MCLLIWISEDQYSKISKVCTRLAFATFWVHSTNRFATNKSNIVSSVRERKNKFVVSGLSCGWLVKISVRKMAEYFVLEKQLTKKLENMATLLAMETTNNCTQHASLAAKRRHCCGLKKYVDKNQHDPHPGSIFGMVPG